MAENTHILEDIKEVSPSEPPRVNPLDVHPPLKPSDQALLLLSNLFFRGQSRRTVQRRPTTRGFTRRKPWRSYRRRYSNQRYNSRRRSRWVPRAQFLRSLRRRRRY